MELIFNELSIQPACGDVYAANLLVEKLIQTHAKAKALGLKKIRFHQVFEEIELMKGFTFRDWLFQTNNRTFKDLLLAAKVYPSINEEDEWAENEYLKSRYFFENEFVARTEPQGLAAAIIYETLAISLPTHEYWRKENLPVFVADENLEGDLTIKNVWNVCEATSFDSPVILDFIGRMTTPVLISSTIAPADKTMHFRDDHGKDKLEIFGRRLLLSEYVVSIINSLPFNPKATNLIRKTYADGKIEMVLYWEDKGLGLVVQSTGRNIHETKAIAEILVQKFDD
jgi:hypothetical protein